MLRELIRVIGPGEAGRIRLHLAAVLCHAVSQGVVFVLLVPLLRALLRGEHDEALRWLAGLAVAALITCAAYYAQALLGFRTAVAATGALYRRLGDHLGDLPLGWFATVRLGPLTRLATAGVGEVTVVFAHLLGPLVTAVATPLTVLVGMAVFDWRPAAAMAVTVPLLYLAYRWSTRVLADTDADVDAAIGRSNDRILEFAQRQPVLRAFGGGRAHQDRLDQALIEQHETGRRQLRRNSVARGLFGGAVQLSVTFVLAVSALLAVWDTTDVPQLVALAVLVVRFAEPVSAVGDLGGSLRTVKARLAQVQEILAVPPLPEPANPRTPADSEIELVDVRFRYPGSSTDRFLLDGVNAVIPANSVTALVGPSGSGKTTLTRLIARFWDVDSGSVRIGGVDVREMSAADRSALVAPVFQHVYLFEGTIEENIRLGRPDASTEDLAEAARLAKVDEIVERLPQGWNTSVGEGGTALSGGERQRVSLARAILKRAPVIILDEATAALDSVNEAAVTDTVRALAGRCTLLVIAHQLSTVVDADRILVLDRGNVREAGTHESLLADGGLYSRFWTERDRVGSWRVRSK
ncbi:ABC transporter ATP-binding protein [Saccharothrix saharensis]|uniref:ABC transporter ATP-binding protein n=1 Tax=Saccharothrix saharensis TaxID=571190 RepID=UPI0036AF52B1